MATFLDKLKKRLQIWHEERADRMENKRQALLDAEAREAVQVMEFNGELFVSMNGVPLLAVYDLNETLPEVVSHARQNYKDWKEEKLWEK